MKKTFLITTTAILIAFTVKAQEVEYRNAPPEEIPMRRFDPNRLRFGVFVAPTLSWMHPTASKSDDGNYYVNNKGSKTGFIWGLISEYRFASNYSTVFGFDINATGGKIDATLNPSQLSPATPSTVLTADYDYKLQYIEIPLALKLHSDPLGKSRLKIFGQLGLTLAVNISRKATYDVAYNDANGVEKTQSGDNEKLQGSLAVAPIILQLNVGAGIEYPIASKLSLYSGIFFNNGFLPSAINPKNYEMGYDGNFSDGNVRLNNIALRIGMFF